MWSYYKYNLYIWCGLQWFLPETHEKLAKFTSCIDLTYLLESGKKVQLLVTHHWVSLDMLQLLLITISYTSVDGVPIEDVTTIAYTA